MLEILLVVLFCWLFFKAAGLAFRVAWGFAKVIASLLLTLAVTIMASLAAFTYLEPVLDFLYRLEQLGDLQSGVLGLLLKITGVSIVTELTAMLCRDSGNGALAQGMQLLGGAVILSLSLPILETMLDLIQMMMGEL